MRRRPVSFRSGHFASVDGGSVQQMARLLAESGDYRVTSRLGALTEYHPPDNHPKLVAAVVDVETAGTHHDRGQDRRTRDLPLRI
jgi:hypothetical protein